MKFDKSIWFEAHKQQVVVIDQRLLPFEQNIYELNTLNDVVFAIKEMVVRGAPLIGVTAAYGLYIAAREGIDINKAYTLLLQTRPTAVNLKWALDRQMRKIKYLEIKDFVDVLLNEAHLIALEDIEMCSKIGENGLQIIEQLYQQKGETINILTHCNAGWLATVQWGTALSPIYKAHLAGIPIHVWVDETRPRNQGARLTAWELQQAGIPHHVIVDNAGGHLMQHKMVDLVIVGSDRTTRNGDVCNKIGTYLKALAAWHNDIPFYAALPISTIDWQIADGLKDIPIEQRNAKEVSQMNGWLDGKAQDFAIMMESCPTNNYAFDVTPAKFVTGIITEKGISKASESGLKKLYGR